MSKYYFMTLNLNTKINYFPTLAASIRSAALRPVSDPVVQMLAVLQKLLFVCDQSQPLADYINHKRRYYKAYQKFVFPRVVIIDYLMALLSFTEIVDEAYPIAY